MTPFSTLSPSIDVNVIQRQKCLVDIRQFFVERLELCDHERVEGRWGGLRLYVTYFGWRDASGYHACLDNATPPAGAPSLLAQTF